MDLTEKIAEHRVLYADDPTSILRMVARNPPTTLDRRTGQRDQEPADVYGMNLNGRLIKYLGHPEGYGHDFPWLRALWRLHVECRRHHRRHRGPLYWDGSLCRQLVRFVVIKEFSVENAARILRYDRPEPTLRNAFRIIEESMVWASDREAKQDAAPKLYGGHIPLPGLHAEECPSCRRYYSWEPDTEGLYSTA